MPSHVMAEGGGLACQATETPSTHNFRVFAAGCRLDRPKRRPYPAASIAMTSAIAQELLNEVKAQNHAYARRLWLGFKPASSGNKNPDYKVDICKQVSYIQS